MRVGVSRLRAAIEQDQPGAIVRTTPGGYLLAAADDELDLAVFERSLREARALRADHPARAAALLREALALWRGPPLADLASLDCLQDQIRRLEQLRLLAVIERIDADLALGGGADLIAELEQLTAAEPLHERLRGQLMLALYRAGRQADALAVYRDTSELLREQLGLEPSHALRELERAILQHGPSLEPDASARRVSARLPSLMNSTIGRERETEAIAGLLRRADVRLVTLVGAGGVGKTRLALVVASAIEPQFRDGACWIDLSGVGRAEDVGITLSQALAVAPVAGENIRDALCQALSGRRMLLVIDNFEHVLDAASLVGELLAECPGLTVLATSREALELRSEHRIVVEPLSVPDRPERATVAEVERTAATAMFIAAARRHDSSFTVRAGTASAVARLCARLDGLPLALELAAARTPSLTIGELATRLDHELSVLGTGSRDAPARQRTLHATIEWSYGLLDQAQQIAFSRFGVFVGGATLEAAEAVTGAKFDTIEALIAKSLLTRRLTSGSSRLTMLETIREYALERLAEDPEQQAIRDRHFEHYLQVIEREKPKLWRPKEDEALAVLDREIGNLRAALQWGLEGAPPLAVRLVGLLADYWWLRQDPDALSWVDATLRACANQAAPKDLAYAQLTRGFLLGQRGEPAGRGEAATAALELYRELGDHAGIATALNELANSAMKLGDLQKERAYAEAACAHARKSGDDATLGMTLAKLARALPPDERRPVLEQARDLLQRVGNYRQLAHAYGNAAYAALVEGRPGEALSLLEVAAPAAEKLGDVQPLVIICGNLGLAHLFLGDLARAREKFLQEVELGAQLAFRYGVEEGLAGLAAITAAEGFCEQAAILIGAARGLGRWEPGDQQILNRLEREYLTPARARLGPGVWLRAEHKGAAMSYEEAIAYARHGRDLEAPPAHSSR